MYIGRSDWPSAVTLERYIDGRNEAYNSSRFCRLSSRARYIVSRNASAGDAVGRSLCVVSMFAIVRLRLDTCALGALGGLDGAFSFFPSSVCRCASSRCRSASTPSIASSLSIRAVYIGSGGWGASIIWSFTLFLEPTGRPRLLGASGSGVISSIAFPRPPILDRPFFNQDIFESMTKVNAMSCPSVSITFPSKD